MGYDAEILISAFLCYNPIMLVSSISQITNNNFQGQNQKSSIYRNCVTWSGYGAVATGIASGVAGHYKKIKLHKQLAYVTGA